MHQEQLATKIKWIMSTLERAIEIARQAHVGQVDKAGRSYFWHAEEVMDMCETETEKIVGVLHDVVEDTFWSFEMLEAEGFSSEVIAALKCVTKLSEDENYEDFISRVQTNPIATQVKKNDLIHNLDLTRLSIITDKDIVRIRKYVHAYERLTIGEIPNARVQTAACVAELKYVLNFCFNKVIPSISECKHRLVKEYRPCLESIIPRFSSIIEGAYDATPWRQSRQKAAKEARSVIIELLDSFDQIVNVPENEFNRSDLTSIGYIIEYVMSELIFYTQKYFQSYP